MSSNGHRDAVQMPAVEFHNPDDVARIAELEHEVERLLSELAKAEGGTAFVALTVAHGRIMKMEDALRTLIARIRRVGGYATPEEQDDLRRAERVLTGVST